jgi:ABC-type bacteriocin/lantibiotic exporter with double-glycine peptidase domain
MLQIDNITFYYDDPTSAVFKDYTFFADSGHSVMIVGDNGSGKSTLGRLIC